MSIRHPTPEDPCLALSVRVKVRPITGGYLTHEEFTEEWDLGDGVEGRTFCPLGRVGLVIEHAGQRFLLDWAYFTDLVLAAYEEARVAQLALARGEGTTIAPPVDPATEETQEIPVDQSRALFNAMEALDVASGELLARAKPLEATGYSVLTAEIDRLRAARAAWKSACTSALEVLARGGADVRDP